MRAVNARGTFVAMREAIPRLRDGGRIVNLSTINTVLPSPTVAVYSAGPDARWITGQNLRAGGGFP